MPVSAGQLPVASGSLPAASGSLPQPVLAPVQKGAFLLSQVPPSDDVPAEDTLGCFIGLVL